MTIKLKIHPIQIGILTHLLFNPEARFKDINIHNIASDHFNFHVKRLLELNLIKKTSRETYKLSSRGKEFSNRLDEENFEEDKTAQIRTLVACTRNRGSDTEFLVQRRLKQPFYGMYDFIATRVKWGEKPEDAAARGLKNETGLQTNISLKVIEHKQDFNEKNELLEDKYLFVFRGEKTTGKLIKKFQGGENIWLNQNSILELPNLFENIKYLISQLNNDQLTYHESKYKVNSY